MSLRVHPEDRKSCPWCRSQYRACKVRFPYRKRLGGRPVTTRGHKPFRYLGASCSPENPVPATTGSALRFGLVPKTQYDGRPERECRETLWVRIHSCWAAGLKSALVRNVGL